MHVASNICAHALSPASMLLCYVSFFAFPSLPMHLACGRDVGHWNDNWK